MDGTLIRSLQLITAILGVIFSASDGYTLLIIAFAIGLVYMILIFLGIMLNKTIFAGRSQTIFDLVVGAAILIIAIYATVQRGGDGGDGMYIASLVCAYVLGPLLLISSAGL